MTYKENPKTKGSGIVCAIPQMGTCPNKCKDCFFQSGRSYLEPLKDNLPNMPEVWDKRVVRVNDGNDSNVDRKRVLRMTAGYPMKFYNTAISKDIDRFDAPVVLTINPAKTTDTGFYKLDPIPKNLMFVRFRANTWNWPYGKKAVKYYTDAKIPIVFTFMAYYVKQIPAGHGDYYTYRKRTLNSYWVITQEAWDMVIKPYKDNPFFYTCGKDANTFPCHRCGNCLREYFATMERI